MNSRMDKLSSAIEDIDAVYLEEALNFESKANSAKRERRSKVHFPRISAAAAALVLVIGLSTVAFAISRMPMSWRDIFNPNQTVIGDDDEANIISEQIEDDMTAVPGSENSDMTAIPGSENSDVSPDASEQIIDVNDIKIDVVKAISDERVLYLLYSMKANDGAFLDTDGRFASFDMFFPDKMMSGVYQQYFLERKDGVPESELEGVIYAEWQTDASGNELKLEFINWQEKKMFEDVIVNFDVSEMVAKADDNADIPCLYTGHEPQYLWQPGNAEIELPYGGVSICNAGWENGVLQVVMKGPKDVGEWATGQNWYFVDTRTGKIINPEQRAVYRTPDEIEMDLENTNYYYFWNFVTVDKETLPYLEMHCGGKESYATVLQGKWKVNINETPVSVKSKLLADNMTLYYAGKELYVNRIECSKLSLAIYFTDYVDPTTGILSEFSAFDANGNPIKCDWGFTADANDNGCMIWTRFEEPVDPESIYALTFNGETVFTK